MPEVQLVLARESASRHEDLTRAKYLSNFPISEPSRMQQAFPTRTRTLGFPNFDSLCQCDFVIVFVINLWYNLLDSRV